MEFTKKLLSFFFFFFFFSKKMDYSKRKLLFLHLDVKKMSRIANYTISFCNLVIYR